MKNIILIGMSGAGKSSTGVILAKTLGMGFIDTDLLMQESENRFLQDIIDSDGIERFKEIEENTLLSLDCTNSVIATGGSAVYSEKAMNHLKRNSTVIYFRISYHEMVRRISNIYTRGIVIKQGLTLLDTFDERTPLYEKYADIVVECTGKEMEEIVTEVCKYEDSLT